MHVGYGAIADSEVDVNPETSPSEPTSRLVGFAYYWSVVTVFARNSLIRDMTFRANFVMECISSVAWTLMNVGFYLLIFSHANSIGESTGWGKYEFFVFMATMWIVNSLVETFFMPNAEEFSELIRTGGLDFALLKPIDTQFLISFRRMDWSSLSNLVMAIILLAISLSHVAAWPLGGDPLSLLSFLWCGDPLQHHDGAGGDQHLAGAQSEPLRLLVLHHQFFTLPGGDLSARLGLRALGNLHLCDSGAGGGQRAGSTAGAASSASSLLGASDGSVRRGCSFRQPVCQSTDFPAGAGQLPKRQQLTDRNGTSRGDWHPARRAPGIPNRGTSSARG